MIVIIDADSIAYKLADRCLIAGGIDSREFEEEEGFEGTEVSGSRLELHTDEHGDSYVVETSIDLAKELVQDYIDDIIAASNDILHRYGVPEGTYPDIEDYKLYLTANPKIAHLYKAHYGHDNITPCFRYEVASVLQHGYKHNRMSKPLHGYMTIMEAMVMHFNNDIFDEIEADDACVAICNAYPDKYFLAALDKDVLNQVVGTHLNYGKLSYPEEYAYETSERYAQFYKYWQAIVGDPTDGYKGCPGIGKVGAAKWIEPHMSEIELFNATLEAFESKSLGYTECIATLRLSDMTQVTITEEFGDGAFKYTLDLYNPPKGVTDGN